MLNKRYQSIHFVGIKGVGMTALAVFAKEAGIKVSGSDVEEEFVTDSVLRKNKISPQVGFNENNLKNKPDLVIVTGAHDGVANIEAVAANLKGIPVITQGQAVGLFMEDQKGISVCGVGGKTTTSAMAATVLTNNRKDPSFIIGCGEIRSLGNPGHFGRGEYCIVEADEYSTCPKIDNTPKFLWQTPEFVISTNIEFDHPDVYKDIEATKNAYSLFFNKIPKDGALIANIDNFNTRNLLSIPHPYEVMTYGVSQEANVKMYDFTNQDNKNSFLVEKNGVTLGEITLKVPGRHNCSNALSVITLCLHLGLDFESISKGLLKFTGCKRRFEYIGERNNILFYDDYAHNPNEIRTTLQTAKEWFGKRKIICIFQPHTYSRTKALLPEFAQSFQKADEVIITDIYSSKREENDPTINGKILSEHIQAFNQNTFYLGSKENVVEFVTRHNKPGSVVITIGAGDVYKWGKEIMENVHD